MAYRQSTSELEKHLLDEVLFLTDACNNYDKGKVAYSKQIATSMRKLVHQTNGSNALLVQLEVRDVWHWKDTAEEIDPANLMFTFGLVNSTISWGEAPEPVTTYNPLLDNYPRLQVSRISAFSGSPVNRERGTPMRFHYWWKRAIMRDLHRNDFSRSDIILNVANKDGGAHIDAKLGEPFAALTRGGSMAIPSRGLDGSMAYSKESPVPATIRQIAFEALATLSHYRPDLVTT